MSKLIDRLTRLSKGGSSPIGFQARKEQSAGLKLQLVARLTQAEAEGLAEQIAAADAGLIINDKNSPVPETLEKLCQNYNDIAWGCWVGGATRSEVKQLNASGGDFTVFSPADTPLDIIDNEGSGLIMEVDTAIEDSMLRTANSLPVDAVLVSDKENGKNLNWHHLMVFQRFAGLLSKPLLASVPVNTSAAELQALWDAGVKGIVVEVNSKTPKTALSKLRKAIDGLEAPAAHRKENHDVLLPRSNGRQVSPSIEEEEEDE